MRTNGVASIISLVKKLERLDDSEVLSESDYKKVAYINYELTELIRRNEVNECDS